MRWVLRNADSQHVQRLALEMGLPVSMARLLAARGISTFVVQTAQAARTTEQLADNLGVSGHELEILRTAVAKVGGTAQEIDGDFRRLNATMASWKFDANIPEGLRVAFQQLRIDGAKFIDQAVPWREKILMLSAAFEKLRWRAAASK